MNFSTLLNMMNNILSDNSRYSSDLFHRKDMT